MEIVGNNPIRKNPISRNFQQLFPIRFSPFPNLSHPMNPNWNIPDADSDMALATKPSPMSASDSQQEGRQIIRKKPGENTNFTNLPTWNSVIMAYGYQNPHGFFSEKLIDLGVFGGESLSL